MKNYQRTGLLPDLIKNNPSYGDFSDPMDFQESMNVVALAQEQFDNLSAKTRERFNNDPEKFLAFCADGANAKEMAKMGLIKSEAIERVKNEKAAARDKDIAEAAKKLVQKDEKN